VKKTWLAGAKSVWADGRHEDRIIFVRHGSHFEHVPAHKEIESPCDG
jgi:hypothetical protein